MDEKFLKEIKNKLISEKEIIKKGLRPITKKDFHAQDKYTAQFPKMGDKPDENAAEVAIYSDRLSLEENLDNRLTQINKALQKIEKDNYGICEKCQKAIDKKRLRIYPEAEYCLKCIPG